MLRSRPQPPEDPRDEQPRIFRIAHRIVEPAADRGAPFLGRSRRRDDGDEYSVPEMWLGSHPRRHHVNRLHLPK